MSGVGRVGHLEDGVQPCGVCGCGVCMCLAAAELREGVGVGDWVQPVWGAGARQVLCWVCLCEAEWGRTRLRHVLQKGSSGPSSCRTCGRVRGGQGRPANHDQPGTGRLELGALGGSGNCRSEGEVPRGSRASGSPTRRCSWGAWCGLEGLRISLAFPRASPRVPLSTPDRGQCPLEGADLLHPRTQGTPREGHSILTEWPVTPVADPWLCLRTMCGEKGLQLHGPGPQESSKMTPKHCLWACPPRLDSQPSTLLSLSSAGPLSPPPSVIHPQYPQPPSGLSLTQAPLQFSI